MYLFFRFVLSLIVAFAQKRRKPFFFSFFSFFSFFLRRKKEFFSRQSENNSSMGIWKNCGWRFQNTGQCLWGVYPYIYIARVGGYSRLPILEQPYNIRACLYLPPYILCNRFKKISNIY